MTSCSRRKWAGSLRTFAIVLLLGANSWTAEIDGAGSLEGKKPEACAVAHLRSSFTIKYVQLETMGAITRVFICADAGTGYVEIPTNEIERLEQPEVEPLTGSGQLTGEPRTAVRLPVANPGVHNLITDAGQKYGIDPDFLNSVVKAESGFNARAVSPKGAIGLMQLMPKTAATLGVENSFDPAANVEGGTKYLRQLLDQYHWDAIKTLAAYNAGPQRVEQYRGIPPYKETHQYIMRIIDDYNRKKKLQPAPAETIH